MNDFRFASPERVHAIWGVLVLAAILVALELRSTGSLDRFVSRILQARLISRASRPRRLLRTGLLAATALFLVLSLMRPQLGLTFVSTPRVGAQLMVCLDVSRSMLAEDVVPNRLERAKAEIRDLLPLLDGDQVGMIAFAGRASILCPLTPDFSFFRLVLDGVTANCVGRGGTRLEEPIRKAIEAFGESGDAARAILLISDGEDHDSFPLEACDAAKERGIQVITIGFGDEGGSPVVVTDPETGAREPLRDREGNPVRSRLDGETLREMALRTDGLYIPAGTGALDLVEIHRDAIAPLMRGKIEGGGRTERQEAYQWPALVALLCLLGSALATARPRSPLPVAFALLVGASLFFSPGTPLDAQSPTPGSPTPGGVESDPSGGVPLPPGGEPDRLSLAPVSGDEVATASESEQEADPDAGLTPRLLHNRALLDLATGDLAAARRRLERAESGSGADAELRYRCRYHLGWVSVKESDHRLADDAEGALEALRAAAERFRDAVRVRPEKDEARHNLEVVLRRMRELADSLREEQDADLSARLDALIERQRALLAEARSLIERDVADPGGADEEPRRREYRAVAATEREILADLEALAHDGDEERRGIEGTPEEELTPEQRLRAAQLAALLGHLTRAQERVGQTRRTLRRQQGDRSARRASLGLSALKRAREQLRDPLQVLDGILPDAQGLARQGIELLRFQTPDFSGAQSGAPPPWLTSTALGEEADEVAGRVGELATRFGGAAAAEVEVDPSDPESASRAKLIELVRTALPHLETAATAFGASSRAYAEERVGPGFEESGAGLTALLEARELFLDVKGLIELLWQDETRIFALLRGDDGVDPAIRGERVPALGELHRKNHARLDRLGGLLAEEAAELSRTSEAPPGETPPSETPPEQLEAMQQRLELARTLLEQVTTNSQAATEWFEANSIVAPESIPLDAGVVTVGAILPPLEQLRRLYFTIIEHLREAARRQQELNDRSADAIATGGSSDAPRLLAPLRPDQDQLRQIAEQIPPALVAQGEAAESAATAPGQDPKEQAQEFARAAELVESAAGEMARAIETLFGETPAFEEGTAAQRAALEQLLEALSLLEPPPPESSGQDQPEQQDQQKSGEDPQQEPRREPVDPAQLLQAVRDREAKRRAEQQRGGAIDPTVDKDW